MCNHSFDCDQNCEYMKSFIKLLEKIKVNQGKFKPNKKNRELWDRFIDYFDIKNVKF